MVYITEQEIRARFERARREANTRYFSATEVLNESRQISDSLKEYDIFLSHSSDDDDLIAGLKLILQNDFGFDVYVDWNDPQLDPKKVSPETASILRERMSRCKCLVYAFSENSKESKWMPWELGYFDGVKKSMVAVLPIEKVNSKSIKGSEYVGLYNVIDFAPSNKGEKMIWVNDGSKYVSFERWLSGEKPFIHKDF